MPWSATDEPLVLANISVERCLFFGVGAIVLAAVPNAPGFGNGLIYRAFFYTTMIGVTVRLFATGILLLLGLSLAYGAGLAIFGSAKGVWIEGGNVAWGRIGTKRIPLTNLRSANYDASRQGVLLERRDGGAALVIPTMGLRSEDAPEPLVSRLRELISKS